MIHIIKKNGKFFRLMIIIFAIILIQFVYAGTVRITSPTSTPAQNFSINVNSTCSVNVNDSIYWNGHAFINGAVSSIETDPKAYNGTLAYNSSLSNYYPISNPYNFINTTGDTWSTNYSLYYTKIEVDTNLSLYYLSSIINQILSGNITSANIYSNNILSGNLTDINNNINLNLTASKEYANSIVASNDTWRTNYSNYYNKTFIDSNFTLYYTKTESNTNLNNNITDTKIYFNNNIAGNLTLTLLKNGSTSATGNFNFGGYNISNIDNITVNKYCNSTKCYVLSDLLTISGSTYNSSYVPYTGATSDVDLGAKYLYFGSYPSIYGLTEHEFRIQVSDGASFSFLDYGGNLIITGYSGGNEVNLGSSTYPFTKAIFDTLTISGANITDSSGAITFNDENLTTSSYGFFGWLGSLTNRITKAWFTNIDISGTIQMNQGNITNATYIIMNEKSGACDLTINHSICSNQSGTFLIGILIPLLGGYF